MQCHAIPCIINNCCRSVPLPCGQYMAIFSSVRSSNSHPDLLLTQHHPLFQNTLHCSLYYHEIPCNTVQYHAITCNTMQYHALPCNTMQYHAPLITADGAYHCPVVSIRTFFHHSHMSLVVLSLLKKQKNFQSILLFFFFFFFSFFSLLFLFSAISWHHSFFCSSLGLQDSSHYV